MKRVVLSLAIVGLSVVGCAKARHLAVVGDSVASTAVFAVDDAEYQACQTHVLTEAQCAALDPKIKAALRDVQTVTATLKALPKDAPAPKSLAELLQVLRDVQGLVATLPPSDLTVSLGQRVNVALDAAITLLASIAGA